MSDNPDSPEVMGQREFQDHQTMWYALREEVEHRLTMMEYHARQMANWNSYLGALATATPDNVVQLRPHTDPEPPTAS